MLASVLQSFETEKRRSNWRDSRRPVRAPRRSLQLFPIVWASPARQSRIGLTRTSW